MSVKTWKKEFYPTEASEAAKQGELAAINHSLQKWQGLLPENLAKHNVKIVGKEVIGIASTGVMVFDSSTCALCESVRSCNGYLDCRKCPLYRVNNSETCSSQYEQDFLGDPPDIKPMITLIESAKTVVEAIERGKQNEAITSS